MEFRLEFNEKHKYFHHDNYSHDENTNGWTTICKKCTDIEFKIFKAYLDTLDLKKELYTKDYILKCWFESKILTTHFKEQGLTISFNGEKLGYIQQ
jgi:hypothetical protein